MEVFIDNRTVLVATSGPSFGAKHDPDHPPGPLRVLEYCSLKEGDPLREIMPSSQSGWSGTSGFRKSGELTLERQGDGRHPSSRGSVYTLHGPDGEPASLFEAHWADWDQQGRLVAAVGGRIMAAKLTKSRGLRWRQLAAMNEEKPVPMEAPEWARHW